MHSKLIRLQTALLTLALLFTVLIPVSAYAEGETAAAQATADGSTTISDPNTLNAWERTQAYNNATTGRIWADKTVVKDKIDLPSQGSIAVPKDDKDADFLVALSALSSYASTTTTNTQALDIVMVLDASGSMKDDMSKSDRTKRMDALKTAVNAFIDSAAAQNANITDKEKEIQLSIVKFAGEYRKAVGNDTNLLGDNYSQIVKDLTVCNAANAPDLKKEVNKIKPGGATRADYGLQHAQTVLNNARPMPKRSSSSLPMARLTMAAGLTIALLPKRLKRLNPSRRQVPRFTRSAFLTMLTRRPMSAELQKKTSSCRRSPATTPLLPTRKRAS